MTKQLFIVKVETADHDADLMDSFAKHLAYRFAGSAFRVIDVQKAVVEEGEDHGTESSPQKG